MMPLPSSSPSFLRVRKKRKWRRWSLWMEQLWMEQCPPKAPLRQVRKERRKKKEANLLQRARLLQERRMQRSKSRNTSPLDEDSSHLTLAHCGAQLLPPHRAFARRPRCTAEKRNAAQRNGGRQSPACRKGADSGTPEFRQCQQQACRTSLLCPWWRKESSAPRRGNDREPRRCESVPAGAQRSADCL